MKKTEELCQLLEEASGAWVKAATALIDAKKGALSLAEAIDEAEDANNEADADAAEAMDNADVVSKKQATEADLIESPKKYKLAIEARAQLNDAVGQAEDAMASWIGEK